MDTQGGLQVVLRALLRVKLVTIVGGIARECTRSHLVLRHFRLNPLILSAPSIENAEEEVQAAIIRLAHFLVTRKFV